MINQKNITIVCLARFSSYSSAFSSWQASGFRIASGRFEFQFACKIPVRIVAFGQGDRFDAAGSTWRMNDREWPNPAMNWKPQNRLRQSLGI
ncbi:hypothetical protein [Noviherbaspirillum massiliense]|uniref:hypothetical protein n=1 Tax=Noviherbaspirillum massiliense TaxID=1465823 RepID=UPI0011DD59F6|nr:hypothetical protein [Noviherbaspirillum massiliense]